MRHMANDHLVMVLHKLCVRRIIRVQTCAFFRMARRHGDACWSDVRWTEILFKYGQRTPIGTIQERQRKAIEAKVDNRSGTHRSNRQDHRSIRPKVRVCCLCVWHVEAFFVFKDSCPCWYN